MGHGLKCLLCQLFGRDVLRLRFARARNTFASSDVGFCLRRLRKWREGAQEILRYFLSAGPLRLTMRKTSFLVWSHFRPSWVTHPPSSWRPLAFLYTPPVDMSLVATSNKDQRLRPPPGKGRFPIFSDDAKAMRETFFSRPFLGSSTHGRKGCGLGKRGGLRGQMTWRICGLGSLPQVTSLIRSVGSERRQKSRVEKRGLKGCWWRFWIFLHCV